MIKKKKSFFLFLLLATSSVAQKKIDIPKEKITDDLVKGVNKVIVSRQQKNTILSQTTLRENYSEIHFVKNEKGLDELDLSLVYDKLSKIRNLEFKIYNEQGELIKTFKDKDFSDISLADGYSILTDDRLKQLNPTHFQYPFYSKFDYEIEHENTIFIPSFSPFQTSEDRVIEATYELTYPSGFQISRNERNFEKYNIVSTINENSIRYQIKDAKAPEWEDLNARYAFSLPYSRISNHNFGLGSVKGSANNWNEFGTWYYLNFLKGLNELPQTTISKIKELTKKATSDIEKAKIVFDYVQNNTRYISIQVGLGGWKPFPANEVDKLGYGDCKALTNYTKSLLEAVGVNSYYTIIHASNRIVDIDEKSIGLQGNHVILTVPTTDGNVFLECTNQRIPFGYLGTSTINRKALVIKPDGAEFVTTYSYNEKQNVLKGNFVIDLQDLQKVKSTITFENKGSFYYDLFSLNTSDKKEINLYVKNTFSKLNGIDLIDYKSTNDKELYTIKENIALESAFVGSKMGNEYMITANSMLHLSSLPKKYKNRQSDFSISRGKTYELTTEYILPNGFDFTFMPENKSIQTEFGAHKIAFLKSEDKLVVKEEFVLKSGEYAKDRYSDYEKFILEVNKSTNSKIIFSKK